MRRLCCSCMGGCAQAIRRRLKRRGSCSQRKFFDVNRYRLGKVGRFRINRKFDLDVPETEMRLRSEDFSECGDVHLWIYATAATRPMSMILTTWAIVACGRLMSWRGGDA